MDKNYKLNSRKHILILTPGFPKDENDYNCIPPLQEFLPKFKLTCPNSKISVIAFQYPYSCRNYLWNGLNIFPLGGKNSKIKKAFVWLRAIRQAKNIHRSYRIDMIHSIWLGECAMIGNILSNKINCEHICTLMGQDVKNSNRYLKRLLDKKIKILALSNNQAEQFLTLTNRKVDGIIPWGIDDQPTSIIERDIDLLAVGSLIPLKNYSLFLKLIEESVKINPDINCILVGAGPESLKLKAMAQKKGIKKNIDFTGLISRTEIFRLMRRSKILVHPSKFEGSGFVFAEALVNGMSIVSFDVGYAQKHPKWFIAKDEQDFIDLSQSILSTSLDFTPYNLFPLTETVEHYASIYGIK